MAKKPALTGWKNLVTEITLDKRFTKGLDGIKAYSHVIIIYWLGQEKDVISNTIRKAERMCHMEEFLLAGAPSGQTESRFLPSNCFLEK